MQNPQYQWQEQQRFPPSEIIPLDAPSPYQQPGQQMPRPDIQRQDIVIYPNRGQILGRTIVIAVCLFLLVIILISMFTFTFTSEGYIDAGDIVGIAILLVILLPFIAFTGWITWDMASLLYPRAKPVLVITGEGIRVSKLPLQSGFFISWAELERIAPSSFMYKYLCFFPKNPDQYLTRFGVLERFYRRLNGIFFGTDLYFPQICMEKPIATVIHQIATQYGPELSYNRVWLNG